MTKVRLDKRVVDLGLASSRERAQALILAGEVVVGDHVATKAGQPVDEEAPVRLKTGAAELRWVSRGALKLERALDHFQLDVRGLRVLDVGASTGGFTDVCLERGAVAVCALDVGYGQLAWKLRQDPRVTLVERTNVRHLEPAQLPFLPDAIVCDVSFISLVLVLPALARVGRDARWMVVLVKPQFEVGKGQVGKGGVVRDEQQRLATVDKVAAAARTLGLEVRGVETSPITGPAGNVEYLLALHRGGQDPGV